MAELLRIAKSLPMKIVVSALVVIAIFSGCSEKAREPFHDGPRSEVVNDDESDVLEFPDGFSNVATKCDHGNRVYVVYRGDANRAAIAVAPNDPTCPQIGSAITVER